MTRFKGDDTGAFGKTFITININNPYEFAIIKAVFVVGCIKKEFINPVFPLRINFNSKETKQLQFKNVAHLIVFDSEGRQQTCEKSFVFKMNEGVV